MIAVGILNVEYALYQTSVIFAGYCHHPAVLGNLLMTHSLYTYFDDFLEIAESLPVLKKGNRVIVW